MTSTSTLFLKLAAVNGFLVVALGAFGAHALKASVPEALLTTWQTAVQYQMFHVTALLALALLIRSWGERKILFWSGLCFCAGILLFSGSLYLLVLSRMNWLGMITPLGGVCFLLGWAFLFKAVLSNNNE